MLRPLFRLSISVRILIILAIPLICTLILVTRFASASFTENPQPVVLTGKVQAPNNSFVTNISQVLNISAEQTPHTLVGSYYSIEDNIDAKLLLNNKGNSPLEVSPTLYNAQGQKLELPFVTVDPQSFRFINLQEWASIGGDSFKSGNIKLFHYGKDLVLGAQIYLTDEARSLSFEEKLAEMGKFDSRRQEGVWWMPSNDADVKVIITNTTDAPLSVTGKLAKKPHHTGNSQTFQLAAHETKVLDLRQDFIDSHQFVNSELIGLSFEHSAAKDALLTRAMVEETERGYSNVVQFSNPGGGKSPEYQGVGFQIEDVAGEQLTPVVVARNVGSETATVTAKIPYTREDGSKRTITLPQERLSPGEMSLIKAQSIIQRVRQEQIKVASLEVIYDTEPGSVIVAAHSVSDDHNQVFRVPMWDPLGQRSPTGGYPWRIEGTSVTETYIRNITDVKEAYVAFLLWEDGGEYMIGMKTIAPRETIHIDIKKLRDEQIPDKKGRTIPLHVSSGQIQWSLRRIDNLPDGILRADLALIGRSEQVDIPKGIVNNYSCMNCCAGNVVSGFIAPNPPAEGPIEVENSRPYTAYEESETCYGYPYYYDTEVNPVNPGVVDWISSDYSVANVTLGLVTGVGAGNATITARWHIRRYISYPCGGGGDDPPLYLGKENECHESEKDVLTRTSRMRKKKDPRNTAEIAPCGTCYSYGGSWISAFASVTVTGSQTPPQVASITASLGAEVFTTTNTSTQYAIDSNDLMVVFKGSDDINIQAQGIYPPSAASQIKWKVDRDPSDTLESELPTISPQTGANVTLTPNTAGNFRLISYYDANNNNTFDNSEELKVLRFAIVRIFVATCTLETENQFMGQNLGDHFKVETSSPIRIRCNVSLQSGGASNDVGLDKVKMGNVGNLISEENQVTYEIGNALENPNPYGGGLPMVTTLNPVLSGGDTIFRTGSEDFGTVSGRQIRSEFKHDIGPFLIQHPDQNNGTTWASTIGTLIFTEFIAAYSETFPQYYVVVAKATVQIGFNGSRNVDGGWNNQGSTVFLQGSLTPLADFTKTVGIQGSVATGSSEGMMISGTPYDASAIYEYSQH